MAESLYYGSYRKREILWGKKGPFSNILEEPPAQSQQYYTSVRQREDSGLKYNGAIKEMHENLIADTYNISPEVLDEISRSELSKVSRKSPVPPGCYTPLKERKYKWGKILRRGIKFQDDTNTEHHRSVPLNNDVITAEATKRNTSGKSLKPTKHEGKSSCKLQHHLNPISKNSNKDKIIHEILNLLEDAHFVKSTSEDCISKCLINSAKCNQKGDEIVSNNSDGEEVTHSNNGDSTQIVEESNPKTKSSCSSVSETIAQEDDMRTVTRGSNRRCNSANNNTNDNSNTRDRHNTVNESDTTDSSTATESTVRHVLPEISRSAKDPSVSFGVLPKMTSKELVWAWLNAYVQKGPRNVHRSVRSVMSTEACNITCCEACNVVEVASKDTEQKPPTISSKRDFAALTRSQRNGELKRIYGINPRESSGQKKKKKKKTRPKWRI